MARLQGLVDLMPAVDDVGEDIDYSLSWVHTSRVSWCRFEKRCEVVGFWFH